MRGTVAKRLRRAARVVYRSSDGSLMKRLKRRWHRVPRNQRHDIFHV